MIARRLARHPDPSMEAELAAALAREPVDWVRHALKEALAAVRMARRLSDDQQPALADLPRELQQLRAEAVQEATRAILHEISPLIGRARKAANNDVFPESRVHRELDALHDVCRALRQLTEATAVPEFQEFDLAQFLSELVAASSDSRTCEVRVSGTAPFHVTSDKGLLTLAIENVLRNAVEATQAVGAAGGAPGFPVIVTWGRDDHGHWVAIIDRGPGIPEDLDVFELGVTTKATASGFGLPTSVEAMRSIGGSIYLETNDEGGTTAFLYLRATT